MIDDEIDVRFEPAHEGITFRDGRPMLTWGIYYPRVGRCWTLWYLEDDTESAGVADYVIPGDLLDVDYAVEQARAWLAWERSYSEPLGDTDGAC